MKLTTGRVFCEIDQFATDAAKFGAIGMSVIQIICHTFLAVFVWESTLKNDCFLKTDWL